VRLECDPNAARSWREGLPMLASGEVVLRELDRADARPLLAIATRTEVTRFAWPAPTSVDAVERFIDGAREERAAGRYICYGIFVAGGTELAGLFELRRLQPDFFRAEAGFMLAPQHWGKGIFAVALELITAFAFHAVGIHRIEARIAVDNDRSNSAMLKLGASNEGRLQEAFVRDGEYVDQFLWSILGR
jgi:ribosomal-protein-alanine N-acetyltransferase